MDELFELLAKPLLYVVKGLVRVIAFVVMDVLHEFVVWSVGWCFYRVITFGRFPQQRIWEDDKGPLWSLLLVSMTGVVLTIMFICVVIFLKLI